MKYPRVSSFRTDFSWLFSIVIFGLLGGCASVNPEPFSKFLSASQQAQTGSDSAMSLTYNWTRSGFLEGFSSNPNSDVARLSIKKVEDYGWTLPQPIIYLLTREQKNNLVQLNRSFVSYAELLFKLADGKLVNPADFDLIATDLNQNLGDAVKGLGFAVPADGIALFSTAASESARLYIENRRQSYLIEAINKNQPLIEEYSIFCIKSNRIIREQIAGAYSERLEAIQLGWKAEPVGEQRQKKTDTILTLNEQYIDSLALLKELETTYGTLPAAHAYLAKAIENPKFDVQGIQKLFTSAKRLQNLNNQLTKIEGK